MNGNMKRMESETPRGARREEEKPFCDCGDGLSGQRHRASCLLGAAGFGDPALQFHVLLLEE